MKKHQKIFNIPHKIPKKNMPMRAPMKY